MLLSLVLEAMITRPCFDIFNICGCSLPLFFVVADENARRAMARRPECCNVRAQAV